MLALARALMLRPKLVLLDEPSLGLAPMVVSEIFQIVGELNEREGLAVLVVEQNAVLALEASSRAYVLEVGKVASRSSGDARTSSRAQTSRVRTRRYRGLLDCTDVSPSTGPSLPSRSWSAWPPAASGRRWRSRSS